MTKKTNQCGKSLWIPTSNTIGSLPNYRIIYIPVLFPTTAVLPHNILPDKNLHENYITSFKVSIK